MRLLLLLFSFLVISASGPTLQQALAQTPTAEAANAARDPFELYRLELQMSESSYELLKSNVTLSRYVAALENLAGPICMPNLFTTLDYRGSPSDPACLSLIQRLLELEPTNPLAACIQDGIFAESCRSAYAAQSVEAFTAYSASQSASDSDISQMQLAFKLANDTARDQVRELEVKVQQLAGIVSLATPAPLDAEKTRAMRALRMKMLRSACDVFRVRLEVPGKRTPGQRFEFRKPTPKPAAKTFKDTMLDSLDRLRQDGPASRTAPQASPSPSAETRLHIRYITETCRSTVQKLLNPPYPMPSAKCYAIGKYSPDCISAIIEERRAESMATSTPAAGSAPRQPDGGLFEEF